METFTFNDVEYKIEEQTEAVQTILANLMSVKAMKDAKAMEANAFAALEARLTQDLGEELQAETAEVVESD